MTRPNSIVGRITQVGLFDRLWRRSAIFGTLTAIFLLLSFFPERHQAAISLTPTDPDSLGLSGTLGQLGAINNVFGNQAAVEIAMRVGKSIYVRQSVIRELNLTKRLDQPSDIALQRWLDDRVVVRSLRGGIITVEISDIDAKLARDIVGSYGRALQLRLAEINKKRTAYKRNILLSLVSDASAQLVQAQSAYDSFRLKNQYAEPRVALAAIGDQVPVLEAKIKAKQIQLATARQIFTDQNMSIKQILAEISALQQQLIQVKARSPEQDDTIGKVVSVSGQLFKLERELAISKGLYDNYLRYLQGTAVEDMTSSANIRVLEEPYIETERQIYMPAMAAAIAFFLLWMSIEFYRLRPPVGAKLNGREIDD